MPLSASHLSTFPFSFLPFTLPQGPGNWGVGPPSLTGRSQALSLDDIANSYVGVGHEK